MFMVAPIGIENEDNLGEIPSFSVQNFMVNGIVAFDEFVESGIGMNEGIFFKKGNGEIFPIKVIIKRYTPTINKLPKS